MRDYKQIAMITCVAAAGLASAGGLHAFNGVEQFTDDPSQGLHAGAGDIWGTGSVRDYGITCAHCHVNDNNQQGMITAQVSFSPALSGGKYVPGTQYTVTVKLLGEHLGTSNQTNNKNGFVATFEDMSGKPIPGLLGDQQSSCPNGAPTLPDGALAGTSYAYSFNGGGCIYVSSIYKNPPAAGPSYTSWPFKWTAPAAGAGTLVLYYGVVDGDAGQSSLGDDVKLGKQMLAEGP